MENSNTSQIVKTYGKPRRTQILGNDSVWHNNLTDDFDKCFGIEDVQQTTFISPEPTSSVSMYNSVKHKKKNENTMNSISKWSMMSMQSHSSLKSHKNYSTKKKRNIDTCSLDYNTYKNNAWLKSQENKIKDCSLRTHFSSSKDLSKLKTNHTDIAGSSKDTLKPNKKLKNKFIRLKNQCSTPLQRLQSSAFNTHQSQRNNKKKSKVQKNLVNSYDVQFSSNILKKSNYSFINSSNSSMDINNKHNQFEQSIQIAGSYGLPSSNTQIIKKNIHTINENFNDNKKNHRIVLNKSKRCNKKKKKKSSSKDISLNWYRKVIKIMNNVETHSSNLHSNEHSDEEIKIDESSENLYSKSFSYELKSATNKPSEQQIASTSTSSNINNKSSQPLKSIENSTPSIIECPCDSVSNCITSNKSIIVDVEDIKDEIINKSKSYILADNITHDSYCNSLYETCYEVESSHNKPNAVYNKSPQHNLFDISVLSSCTTHIKLNPLRLNNFNQSSHLSVTNIDHKFNNQQSGCCESNSKSFMLEDVMNKFSDISISNEITHYDQSLEKLVPNISRNSSSVSQSSCYLEQETVIEKENCIDEHSKENFSYQNGIFYEKNIVPLINPSKYFLKDDSLKNDDMYGHKQCLNSEDITLNNHIKITETLENSLIDLIDVSPIKNEINSTIKDEINTFSNVSRRKRYGTRFQNNFDVVEESFDDNEIQSFSQKYVNQSQSTPFQQDIQGFRLEPGKKWRRSIIIVRNFVDGQLDQTANISQNITRGRKWISTVDGVLRQQSIDTTIHQRLDQSNIFRDLKSNTSQRFLQRNSIDFKNDISKRYILEKCQQQYPIPFASWFESKIIKKWSKVGEGVFGEVFSYSNRKVNTVVKIIPIEGKHYINSEKQKMFHEVYTEILIAFELNQLSDNNGWNQCNSFCRLKNISCVQGKYPAHLIELWEQYNDNKGSDNDNPHILPNNQMFMVLEMEDGGIDVESFVFNSAYQSLFAFLQIVFALAVAEQQYHFEHRDLHIGNILVKKTAVRKHLFKLDGESFTIPSRGVKITIIDFTLSRITHYNEFIYNNLAEDTELFASDGDYQFEIYRLMRKETNDQWELYKPKTNIYWLHYVLDKMIESVHYKRKTTAVHKTGIQHLQKLKSSILLYNCAKSFAESDLVQDFIV